MGATRAQRIRLDESGPELECRWCDEFWPLTLDYWKVQRSGQVEADRCRSCEQERDRLRYQILRLDPTYMEKKRLVNRAYKAALRRSHPQLMAAYEREKKAARRLYQREKKQQRRAA